MFATQRAFRAVIDAPRPNLRSLVCYSSPSLLTDGEERGGVGEFVCSFHNYQLSPILQRGGDGNITGRIPLETEKTELILCLVFIFPVAGLLSPCIVSAVNEKGKGGCGVGRGGGWGGLLGRGTAKG